ncbi:MAG: hypothetical protein PHH03_05585 [Eubacteriales bacterium]|nr:hypothetical protein [Eubacteriales bacterium]
MERNERLLSALTRLKPLYFECRRTALAISLAITLDKEEAYRAAENVFFYVGKRLYRHKEAVIQPDDILSRAAKEAPAKKGSDDFVPFSGLDKREKCAWVMHHVLAFGDERSSKLLSVDLEAYLSALATADAALMNVSPSWFAAMLDRFLGAHEMWETVVFRLERHYRGTRLVGRIVLTLVTLAAAAVMGIEAWTAFKVFRLPSESNSAVIADVYSSEQYYKRLTSATGADNSRVSATLLERLENMGDAQLLRVSFRFYDPDAMSRVTTPSGDTLLSLYTDMYQKGNERGLKHRFIAHAIQEYYGDYVMPLLPEMREADFRSSYDSVYDAALTLSSKGSSGPISEILSSREQFDDYLYSDAFLGEVLPVARLLQLEKRLQDAGFAPEDGTLVDAYEEAVFAFRNPSGLDGTYSPAPFAFSREETDTFFALREDLGKKLYAMLVDTCTAALPNKGLTSDVVGSTDCSLFSATLTKRDVMDLSLNDVRFYFLGVAAPYMEEYPANIEHALAAAIAENKLLKQAVYKVDKEFLPYSINYMAPLNLPQGFIDQLRAQVSSKDTLFEQLLGFRYDLRFAHPLNVSGYRILRRFLQGASDDAGYCLQAFKNFTKMSPN